MHVSFRVLPNTATMVLLRFAPVAFALMTILVVPSYAPASETDLDLSLGPLVGTHAEAGTRDAVAPVPIPILAVSHRESMFEVFAEGLPFSPPIDSSSATESVATNLTFENVLLRAYVLHDRLSFGAGETVYNQVSRYQPGGEIDASRVVGGRYVIAAQPLANRGFRIALDLVPVLHGTIRRLGLPAFDERFATAPETGTQSKPQLSQANHARRMGVWRSLHQFCRSLQRLRRTGRPKYGFRPYVSFGVHPGHAP
jgi:hypothetical protein